MLAVTSPVLLEEYESVLRLPHVRGLTNPPLDDDLIQRAIQYVGERFIVVAGAFKDVDKVPDDAKDNPPRRSGAGRRGRGHHLRRRRSAVFEGGEGARLPAGADLRPGTIPQVRPRIARAPVASPSDLDLDFSLGGRVPRVVARSRTAPRRDAGSLGSRSPLGVRPPRRARLVCGSPRAGSCL